MILSFPDGQSVLNVLSKSTQSSRIEIQDIRDNEDWKKEYEKHVNINGNNYLLLFAPVIENLVNTCFFFYSVIEWLLRVSSKRPEGVYTSRTEAINLITNLRTGKIAALAYCILGAH